MPGSCLSWCLGIDEDTKMVIPRAQLNVLCTRTCVPGKLQDSVTASEHGNCSAVFQTRKGFGAREKIPSISLLTPGFALFYVFHYGYRFGL